MENPPDQSQEKQGRNKTVQVPEEAFPQGERAARRRLDEQHDKCSRDDRERRESDGIEIQRRMKVPVQDRARSPGPPAKKAREPAGRMEPARQEGGMVAHGWQRRETQREEDRDGKAKPQPPPTRRDAIPRRRKHVSPSRQQGG